MVGSQRVHGSEHCAGSARRRRVSHRDAAAGGHLLLSCRRLPSDRPSRAPWLHVSLGGPQPRRSRTNVTLSLADLGNSTELTVDQGPFLNEARLALHVQGWTENLDRLYDVVAWDAN